MEGVDEIRGVTELRGGEPGGFFVGAFVTRPTNEIEEFALATFVDLGVEDFANLVLEVSVDFDRRWRRFDTAGNGAGR